MDHVEPFGYGTRELQRFAQAVEAVSYPPGVTPLISLVEGRAAASAEQRLAHYDTLQPFALIWRDGPVALGVRSVGSEVIAVEITHRNDPDEGETRKDMLVFAKSDFGQVTRFLETVTEQKRAPRVHTFPQRAQELERYGWDQLTLAPEIRTLFRQDFEMFFAERNW